MSSWNYFQGARQEDSSDAIHELTPSNTNKVYIWCGFVWFVDRVFQQFAREPSAIRMQFVKQSVIRASPELVFEFHEQPNVLSLILQVALL